MSPRGFHFWRWGEAGLPVGVIGCRQTKVGEAKPAGVDHFVKRGQVVTVFDGVLRCSKNHGGRVGSQSLQPEPFDLFYLLGVAPSCVILVVIVEAKESEDLIDGLY